MQNGKNPFGIVLKSKFHSSRKKSQTVCSFWVILAKNQKRISKLSHVFRKMSFWVNSSIQNLFDLFVQLKVIYLKNAQLHNRLKIYNLLNNNKSQIGMPNSKLKKNLQIKRLLVNKKKLPKEKEEKTLIINKK